MHVQHSAHLVAREQGTSIAATDAVQPLNALDQPGAVVERELHLRVTQQWLPRVYRDHNTHNIHAAYRMVGTKPAHGSVGSRVWKGRQLRSHNLDWHRKERIQGPELTLQAAFARCASCGLGCAGAACGSGSALHALRLSKGTQNHISATGLRERALYVGRVRVRMTKHITGTVFRTIIERRV